MYETKISQLCSKHLKHSTFFNFARPSVQSVITTVLRLPFCMLETPCFVLQNLILPDKVLKFREIIYNFMNNNNSIQAWLPSHRHVQAQLPLPPFCHTSFQINKSTIIFPLHWFVSTIVENLIFCVLFFIIKIR